MNEDDIRQFDEGTTEIVRTIPGFLWAFYEALEKEGFSKVQALDLT